jgi:hypothetical protein
MGSLDVNDFLKNAELLAARIPKAELGGIFEKKIKVPPNVVALVTTPEGKREVALPGDEKSKPQEVMLVREGETALEYALEGLLSSDGLAVRVKASLVVAVRKEEIDLNLFRRNILKRKKTYTVDQLHGYFQGPLKEIVTAFVRARDGKALYAPDVASELGTAVREGLKPFLFEGGFKLNAVQNIDIYSESFEKEQMATEEVRSTERVEALRKALSFRRAEEEIRLQSELKKQRIEETLGRYEDIRGRLGNDDLRATILLLEDEKTKARLIESLIERELPEEAQQRLEISKLREEVKAWITDLSKQMRVRLGDGGPRQVARSLLAVAGKEVLAYDPKKFGPGARPTERHDFSEGELGYLRSVRYVADRNVLLAGAQDGVYVKDLGTGDVREFAFPQRGQGKGGVNASAVYGNDLFATHSEQGLFKWDLHGISRGEAILKEATSRNPSTRGAQVAEGHLFFCTGPEAYAIDLVSWRTTDFRGFGDPITSIAAIPPYLFGGTKLGVILQWKLDAPGNPQALSLRESNPIYMMKFARVNNVPSLVIGAKDFRVNVKGVDDEVITAYLSGVAIRWVDGSSDEIFGVDREGYRVYVWDVKSPQRARASIRLDEKVQDIGLICEEVDSSS